MTPKERAREIFLARRLAKAGVTPPAPTDSVKRFRNGIAVDLDRRDAEAVFGREGADDPDWIADRMADAAFVKEHHVALERIERRRQERERAEAERTWPASTPPNADAARIAAAAIEGLTAGEHEG